jgi:hypothetical protein
MELFQDYSDHPAKDQKNKWKNVDLEIGSYGGTDI